MNNQHVLLEQLEGHQVNIPYSCRAGVCGCCKVTLVSGEVTPLKVCGDKRERRYSGMQLYSENQYYYSSRITGRHE